MELKVSGLDSESVRRLRAGGPDAHGQPALRRTAAGMGNPCRHCLGLIAPGDEKLVLAWRPFDADQPYAETGPIFLHAQDCPRYEGDRLPGWFQHLQPALVRGYDARDWIVYDSAEVLPGAALEAACRRILARADVSYVHVRSKFNCFQCRVDRA